MPTLSNDPVPVYPMNAAYYYLAIAICSEVIIRFHMKAIKGFSTPIPLPVIVTTA